VWYINNQVPGLSLVWLVHVLLDDQGFRSWICNSEITSLENDGDGHTQCIVADQSHIQCYNKIWNSVTIILRTARCNFNHWIWIPWMVGSTVSSNMEIIKDPGYMWLKDSFEAGHLAGFCSSKWWKILSSLGDIISNKVCKRVIRSQGYNCHVNE
jgi:hypothetical protein